MRQIPPPPQDSGYLRLLCGLFVQERWIIWPSEQHIYNTIRAMYQCFMFLREQTAFFKFKYKSFESIELKLLMKN